MAYTRIDLENWKRKDQYHFFKGFQSPQFNVTANVEVGALLKQCRESGTSFFLCSVFYALKAAHEIEEFRLRIAEEEVHQYETINAGVTILMEDETFIYCTLEYHEDLGTFLIQSKNAIEDQKKNRGFKAHDRQDMIFFSALPLVSFTSIQHAMNGDNKSSIPRIVFGKYFKDDGKVLMPVAVQVHHAVADGFHVGAYFQLVEKMFGGMGK